MLGHAAFDVAQEAQELLMPMPQLALSADLAVGDVERESRRLSRLGCLELAWGGLRRV